MQDEFPLLEAVAEIEEGTDLMTAALAVGLCAAGFTGDTVAAGLVEEGFAVDEGDAIALLAEAHRFCEVAG